MFGNNCVCYNNRKNHVANSFYHTSLNTAVEIFFGDTSCICGAQYCSKNQS